jgi:hypothetical protein
MFAELTLSNSYHRRFLSIPFTFGIPVPRGVIRDAAQIGLLDGRGQPAALDVTSMATWEDGSIRWALLDFIGDFDPSAKSVWRVALNEKTARPPPPNPVRADDGGDVLRVANGILELEFFRRPGNIFPAIRANGVEIVGAENRSDISAISGAGKIHRASAGPNCAWRIEQSGAVRTVIRLDGGLFDDEGQRLTEYTLKFHVFADNPYLKIQHTVVNRELPERGVILRAYRLDLDTRLAAQTTKVVHQRNHGVDWFARLVELPQSVRIVVPTDAQGGQAPGEPALAGVYGTVGRPLLEDEAALGENTAEYPHFLAPDAPRVRLSGGYAVLFPYLGVRDKQRTAVASILRMAPQHPKALSAAENRISFELYPEGAAPWRLCRGMSKTHHLALSCFGRPLDAAAIDHEATRREFFAYLPQDPIQLSLDPAYARQTGEVEQDAILPHLPDRYPKLEAKIEGLKLHGDPLAYAGIMDWGEKIMTNNEEDQGYEYAMEYFRCGRYVDYLRCVQQMLHNTTVDVVTWDPDPLRMGGTPYHTSYHQDAVCVPSHTWTEGMFIYAYLTGDREAYQTAVNVCEWLLRYMRGKPQIVRQDGREIGWPIVALTAGYRATWDRRYRDAAFELVACYKEKIKRWGFLGNAEPPGTDYCVSGYGEYAGFEGMHKLWRLTRDEELRQFAAGVIGDFIAQGHIRFHEHGRMMDLYALYAVHDMTGDPRYLELAQRVLPIALARPNWDGYFYRRILHFLGWCHAHNLIDDRDVVLKE